MYVLQVLPVNTKILITEVAFKLPVVGMILKGLKHIPVKKQNKRESYNLARQCLLAGGSILIFPEGALSHTNTQQKIYTGAFRLSQELNIPIIPLKVTHYDNIIWDILISKELSRFLLGGVYIVEFCKPGYLKKYYQWLQNQTGKFN